MKKMRFPFLIWICLSLLCSAFASETEEMQVDESGIYAYISSEEGVTLSEFLSSDFSGVLKIPETIAGQPVIAIGEMAFCGVKNVWSVVLPNSIQTIGRSAFSDSGIRSIVINEGLKEIDEAAFARSRITSIYIPASVERMEQSAFYGCSNLRSVRIDAQLKKIGWRTFFECISLYEIALPQSIKLIEDEAFYFCQSLHNIELPEHMEEIGNNAFWGCENLLRIRLPRNLQNIGDGAFEETGVETIYISKDAQFKWPEAFRDSICIVYE